MKASAFPPNRPSKEKYESALVQRDALRESIRRYFEELARNIKLGSCASMASLVLPAGITSDGLPVGLEFDALAGNDRQLLSLGLLFEQALGQIPGPQI